MANITQDDEKLLLIQANHNCVSVTEMTLVSVTTAAVKWRNTEAINVSDKQY